MNRGGFYNPNKKFILSNNIRSLQNGGVIPLLKTPVSSKKNYNKSMTMVYKKQP